MLNFKLTKEEFMSLAMKYKTDDPEGNKFNYVAFCQTINAAFTTYGIQKDPLASVSPVTVDKTVLARRKYLDITDEEFVAI